MVFRALQGRRVLAENTGLSQHREPARGANHARTTIVLGDSRHSGRPPSGIHCLDRESAAADDGRSAAAYRPGRNQRAARRAPASQERAARGGNHRHQPIHRNHRLPDALRDPAACRRGGRISDCHASRSCHPLSRAFSRSGCHDGRVRCPLSRGCRLRDRSGDGAQR